MRCEKFLVLPFLPLSSSPVRSSLPGKAHRRLLLFHRPAPVRSPAGGRPGSTAQSWSSGAALSATRTTGSMRCAKILLSLRSRGDSKPEKFASGPKKNRMRLSLQISAAHYRRASKIGRNIKRVGAIPGAGTLAVITRRTRARYLLNQTARRGKPAAAVRRLRKTTGRIESWN